MLVYKAVSHVHVLVLHVLLYVMKVYAYLCLFMLVYKAVSHVHVLVFHALPDVMKV